MLSYNFLEFTFFGYIGLLFIFLWVLYSAAVNSINADMLVATDKKKKKPEVDNNFIFLVLGLFFVWILLVNYLYIQKISNNIIFWDNLSFSNNTTAYLQLIVIVLAVILAITCVLFRYDVVFTVEYLIFVFVISISSYLLMASTNLFLTVFILELISILILGKFIMARMFVHSNPVDSAAALQLSYNMINALFLQFWANFISSVLLFYALINIHHMFGLSNFFFLNFFSTALSLNWYIPKTFSSFVFTALTTGLFIKLGIAPYQFFKIELYKGVPMFMVVVYTTLYLVIYVYFFIYLYLVQIPMLRDFTGLYMLVSVCFAMFYTYSLLFDTRNFKAFLSYSTLINVINIFIVILIA